MSAVLTAFGIDWRLLAIDTANFGLLLLVLWYFLYGPLMRMLDERRARIAQSMRDADETARQLAEVQESRAGLLAQAGKEADELVAHARAAAHAKEQEIAAEAQAQAARALAEASAEAAQLKLRALEESKQEVAKLIVLGMEKLGGEKLAAGK